MNRRRIAAFCAAVLLVACASPPPQPSAPAPAPLDTGAGETAPSRPADDTDAPAAAAPSPDADTEVEAHAAATPEAYPWLDAAVAETLSSRFAPPSGYRRVAAEPSSFAAWLRGLPLLPGRPDVLLFNGRKKGNQSAQAAVVDIDVGNRDLQQCADAVMRLRAEYLRVAKRDAEICFRFTSGSDAVWTRWRAGERPSVDGRKVTWRRKAGRNGTYAEFKRYLIKVFQYAGTASLEKELEKVVPPRPVAPGDVFIEGGFPGHAVVVVDVAEKDTGERVFLLLQSYMPAQQMHILKNPDARDLSPWYRYHPAEPLTTPEWRFSAKALRRFAGRPCDR